eukprot:6489507-Amphidinium_carterae.2
MRSRNHAPIGVLRPGFILGQQGRWVIIRVLTTSVRITELRETVGHMMIIRKKFIKSRICSSNLLPLALFLG